MKTRFSSRPFALFAAAAISLCALAPAVSGAPLIKEKFESLPDSLDWKVRGAEVVDGKLILKGEGNEAGFVGTSIEITPPRAGLNFATNKVKITLTDLNIGGTAPAPKQVFVMVLGSDKASEGATGYVRFVVNGDGTLILSVPGERTGDTNKDVPLLNRPIGIPCKKITLTLDRQGYSLEIIDGPKPQVVTEKWGDKVNWTSWDKAVPYFVVKGVRRPSTGDVQVTLGELAIDSSK